LESHSPDVPPFAETIKKSNIFCYHVFIFILLNVIYFLGKCSQDNIEILLNKLKSTGPKTPPPPSATTSDEKFSDYLCSIMEHLPKAKKLKLQAKFINDILNESKI